MKLRAQHNKHQEKLAEIKHSDNAASASRQYRANEKPRKRGKYKKNDISGLIQEDFDRFALEHLFGYQRHLRANLHQQIRNILKSCQISATLYFSIEAFKNAVMTGNRQIFLSASKAQAEVYRSYIVNIAEQYFGVELRDGGRLCPDGQWRYIFTMEDAITGEFNLASIEKLRNRDIFNMLYMYMCVYSKDSVFSFSHVERCCVDSDIWEDHDENLPRPFGNRAVWAGYDHARSGDTSTFVIIAPPIVAGEKFRVLSVFHWQGMNWKWQAAQI